MYPPLDSSVFGFSLTATTTGMEISPKKKKVAACPVIALHKLTRVTPPTRLLLAASIKPRALLLAQKAAILLV